MRDRMPVAAQVADSETFRVPLRVAPFPNNKKRAVV